MSDFRVKRMKKLQISAFSISSPGVSTSKGADLKCLLSLVTMQSTPQRTAVAIIMASS